MKDCVVAIINPISGTGSKVSVGKILADAFAKTEREVFFTFTKGEGHATRLAERAVKEGASLVIAVGGDGTVNEVAKALINTDVPLGIVPKGSGNGLARALKLPLTVQGAVDVIMAANERVIDCCKANDRPFFCTCGMGFDAEVSEKFAEAPFRGPLSYVHAVLNKYLSYQPNHYHINIDGEEIDREAFLIAAANAPQYGNNAYIAPDASLSDGELDLVIMKPFSDIEAAQIVLQLFTRNLSKNANMEMFKARRVLIKRHSESVMHLDGDPVWMEREVEIVCLHHAIRVLAPFHKHKGNHSTAAAAETVE